MAPAALPLRFSFNTSRPAGLRSRSPPEAAPLPSASEAAGALAPEAAVVAPALVVLVEVLEEDLAVVIVKDGASELVAEALKDGGLLAAFRRPGKANACWCVLDPDKADPPEGCEAKKVACFRLRHRQKGARGHQLEALALLCKQLTEAGLAPQPLAANGEDIVLVERQEAGFAAQALVRAGHGVTPPGRIAPTLKDVPLQADHAEKLCGVWRLAKRQRPPGAADVLFSRDDSPLRIQAQSGVWAEVDIGQPGQVTAQASSVGVLRVSDGEGRDSIIVERHGLVSFAPPLGGPRTCRVAFESGGGDEGEDVAIETLLGAGSDGTEVQAVERWERIASGEVTVLELSNIEPALEGGRQGGFWLFCGGHWLRVTGPCHGEGVIASTCCRSHAQAQELHGSAAVDAELREQYRASCGVFTKPGLLSLTRESWSAVAQPRVIYDASRNRDEVRKEDDVIVHAPGIGPMTAWEVRAFAVDPFTPLAPKPKGKQEAPKGLRKRGKSSSDAGSEKNGSDDSSASGKKNSAKRKKSSDVASSSSGKAAKKLKEKKRRQSSSDSSASAAKRRRDKTNGIKKKKKDKSKSQNSAKKKAKDSSRSRLREKTKRKSTDSSQSNCSKGRKEKSKKHDKKDKRSKVRDKNKKKARQDISTSSEGKKKKKKDSKKTKKKRASSEVSPASSGAKSDEETEVEKKRKGRKTKNVVVSDSDKDSDTDAEAKDDSSDDEGSEKSKARKKSEDSDDGDNSSKEDEAAKASAAASSSSGE